VYGTVVIDETSFSHYTAIDSECYDPNSEGFVILFWAWVEGEKASTSRPVLIGNLFEQGEQSGEQNNRSGKNR
jgi:hypothetical protein